MSALIKQVASLIAAIEDECPAHLRRVDATFYVEADEMVVRVARASREVFAPQGDWGDLIHHNHDAIAGLGATLRFRSPLTGDPVALCERALAFVRAEASVPC